tara:strand:+ start:2718 stop:2933 length:216 start_codon:yes stop_codon:yes gene_type:complete
MIIQNDIYIQQFVKVPEEILKYCDYFTYDATRDQLRYLDCVYMNMGEYGNDPEKLEEMRKKSYPLWGVDTP